MANRYWVGGDGTWDTITTTNWSASAALSFTASCTSTVLTTTGSPALVVGMTVWSSTNVSLGTIVSGSLNSWVVSIGGTYASQTMTAATTGVTVPNGVNDNVFVTSTSGSPTITLAGVGAKSLTTTGATCTFAGTNLSLQGSLTLSSTTTWTSTGLLSFVGAVTGTITTNGVTLPSQVQIGTAGTASTFTLGSALTTTGSRINFAGGTFNLGGFNLTTTLFDSNNSNTRALNLTNSTVTITGSAFNITTSTGMTLTSTNSSIIISSTGNSGISGGGLVYNNLTFGSAVVNQIYTITGSNTFNTIATTKTVAWVLRLASGSTTTVSNFNLSGTAGNLITLDSSTVGTQATISKASGTVTVTYMSIKDSNATGGAIWDASSSTNGNAGNNTGWSFIATGQASNFFLLFA